MTTGNKFRFDENLNNAWIIVKLLSKKMAFLSPVSATPLPRNQALIIWSQWHLSGDNE